MPVDYVKSSPYLLSFMDRYELKKNIETVYENCAKLPISRQQQTYLIKEDLPYKFKDIAPNNARLDLLINEAFENSAEQLLWVPTLHPYYTTPKSNVFEKNKHFSKILVFSAWEMVPRMIACMLSYKAEQLVVRKAFEDATYTNRKGRPQMDKDSVLFTPFRYLSNLYCPKDYYGWPIDQVRRDLRAKIRQHIEAQFPQIAIGNTRCSENLVIQTAGMLDGDATEYPERISHKVISLLADIAIASPAVCLLRILKDEERARKTAENFQTLFNRRQTAAILQNIYNRKDRDIYYEQVLDYCVMGNFQAVLDEFAYMLGGSTENIAEGICEAFVETANQEIHTGNSFGNSSAKKFSIRTHYAIPFGQAKLNNEKINRSNSIRRAFNSPFQPFVLASTSVGQEGLDFHWYCRKIMHWNLPSNPQDLEQREGRINRYQCLAIRRNIAKLFGNIFDWQEMFSTAHKQLHEQYPECNDMIPYWCLPPKLIEERNDELEMIERIVPVYPMSIDIERYKKLISVLSLYRLTMGQPRQEELLELLKGKVNTEQIRKLLFDFSPYSKQRSCLHSKEEELC